MICASCGGHVGKHGHCVVCGRTAAAPTVSVRAWLLYLILLTTPIVGLVLAVVWSRGTYRNPVLRNLGRAYLLLCGICMLIYIPVYLYMAQS